jgi:hypothetical protein
MVANKGFCLKLCSDLDFEGMVVDICFDDQPIASVNYDKGIDSIEIEIVAAPVGLVKKIFPLDDFISILESSKKLAVQCAKEDEERK